MGIHILHCKEFCKYIDVCKCVCRSVKYANKLKSILHQELEIDKSSVSNQPGLSISFLFTFDFCYTSAEADLQMCVEICLCTSVATQPSYLHSVVTSVALQGWALC